jgi:hypothetical protein
MALGRAALRRNELARSIEARLALWALIDPNGDYAVLAVGCHA